MNNSVIRIENVSKLYRLGELGTGTLVHDLNRWWAMARGKEDPCKKLGEVNTLAGRDYKDYIWALRNLNIEINRGEIVGFIGSNGAGKSTLLKLISKITAPTEGIIKISGRMASLLEIGTGMHPDMTARENIYMNGAILGMKKKEITERFDEIIDFSGCSLYVDTPIKRFSSGMRVRLGFSVAAFLNSDILLLDEVLAVGDAEFQSRAIGRIGELSTDNGRTVLFVSHNLETIEYLCSSAVFLENGEVNYAGNVRESITRYLEHINTMGNKYDINDWSERAGNGDIRITNLQIENMDNNNSEVFVVGSKLRFRLFFKCSKKYNDVRIIIGVRDQMNSPITRFDSYICACTIACNPAEENEIICETDQINVKPGNYYINVTIISNQEIQDQIIRMRRITIQTTDYFNTGKMFDTQTPVKILIRHKWNKVN